MIYKLNSGIIAESFGYVRQKSGFWHGGRTLTSNLIIYCTDGNVEMQVGSEAYTLSRNDILLVPSGVCYRPLGSDGVGYYFFHFSANEIKNPATESRSLSIAHSGLREGSFAYSYSREGVDFADIGVYTKNADIGVAEVFKRAEKHQRKMSASHIEPLNFAIMDCYLREILILTAKSADSSCFPKVLSEITVYIGRNYGKPCGLSELSKHFGISQSYIARLFREKFSMTPSEYVNKVRVSAAESLITDTGLSVSEISEKVGFSDIYYFWRIVK